MIRRAITSLVASCAVTLMLASSAMAQQPADAAATSQPMSQGFFGTFWKAYLDEFRTAPSDEAEPPRRALPAPLDSPQFPSSEWQGFPLVGVPYSTKEYPLTKALYTLPGIGSFLKEERIKV